MAAWACLIPGASVAHQAVSAAASAARLAVEVAPQAAYRVAEEVPFREGLVQAV
jgi:hypothetical protein